VYSSHVLESLGSIEHSELCVLMTAALARQCLIFSSCKILAYWIAELWWWFNVPAVASFHGYTDGFVPLAAVPPPQQWIAAASYATYYAAALHLEPGHSLLYCGSGAIYRQRYHLSATLQACLE
jgi:hypothetical protein